MIQLTDTLTARPVSWPDDLTLAAQIFADWPPYPQAAGQTGDWLIKGATDWAHNPPDYRPPFDAEALADYLINTFIPRYPRAELIQRIENAQRPEARFSQWDSYPMGVVIERSGTPVGLLSGRYDRLWWTMERLAILPDLRNQGIGSELVDAWLDRLFTVWKCIYFRAYVPSNSPAGLALVSSHFAAATQKECVFPGRLTGTQITLDCKTWAESATGDERQRRLDGIFIT